MCEKSQEPKGGVVTHDADEYEELGPEYRPTPLPTYTAEGLPTLLQEDPPLGEGRDEFGNDVSAKLSQDIFRAACKAHIEGLEAEGAAVRDGTHEEILRKKSALEECNKRRRREWEKAEENDREKAEAVYQAKKEAIDKHYNAAAYKVPDEGVEKGKQELEAQGKKGGKAKRRANWQAAQKAAKQQKFLDAALFGIEEMTATQCHRKYAKKEKSLMAIDCKLTKEVILQDIADLRSSCDEDERSSNSKKDDKKEESFGCKRSRSVDEDTYGIDASVDGGTGVSSPLARRTGGDRAAKRACYGLLHELFCGGGGGGGGGADSRDARGKRRALDESESDGSDGEGEGVRGNGSFDWGRESDGGGGGYGGEGADGRFAKRRRS